MADGPRAGVSTTRPRGRREEAPNVRDSSPSRHRRWQRRGLQTLVQGYADESGVTVRELNVAGSPTVSALERPIPRDISAIGTSGA